jgi:hypothetical protein
MRRLPLGLPILAATIVALVGCAPGADGELKGLIDEVVPARHEMVECEWGRNWGGGGPDKYYGCVYLVAGKSAPVSQVLFTRLETRGFVVECIGGMGRLQLNAERGETVLHAVIHRAQVDASIPPGHVAVELAATKGAEHETVVPGFQCPGT